MVFIIITKITISPFWLGPAYIYSTRMAAFQGMHASPAKRSYVGLPRKCDKQADWQDWPADDTINEGHVKRSIKGQAHKCLWSWLWQSAKLILSWWHFAHKLSAILKLCRNHRHSSYFTHCNIWPWKSMLHPCVIGDVLQSDELHYRYSPL